MVRRQTMPKVPTSFQVAPHHQQTLRPPGIQISKGSFSVEVGVATIVLSAANWDTITGRSEVTRLVNVVFDKNVNITATTRSRFQYLADLIYQHRINGFDPLGI